MQYLVDTYTLEYLENENKYFISFKDSVENDCKIEISREIFEEYMISKRAYKKVQNEFDRHQEQSEQSEITLYKRSIEKVKSAEEQYIENISKEKLKIAEKELTETQMRRIELHFIDKITIRDLAKMENVRKKQIEKSIQLGLKKLKKFFEN